jgi:RES domain-containing protein
LANREREPGVQELFDAIASCLPHAISVQGVVFRSTGLKYANEHDLVSGAGAAAVGGRWNRRGMRAIYASLSHVTAVHESYRGIEAAGFTAGDIRPRVFCGAVVRLQAVLDLTERGIRRRIGFTLEELVEEDWLCIQEEGDESWTQAIGRGAHAAGFEGLLTPSARDRPQGKNLIIFPDRLRIGSFIEIQGKDELPAHPRPR